MLTPWHLHWNIISSTVDSGAVITCCYDTKSQKQPRLYPELMCDWCVFCKPKKSIHWVAQKTNSSTSFGVSSSSLWLSEHSFSWCSNYRREKESPTEIQHQATNFADIAQRKVKYFCLYSFAWKTGLKYSLLAVNSPSLPAEPQLTFLALWAVSIPNAKLSLHKLGTLKSRSECLAANKQMKRHITE